MHKSILLFTAKNDIREAAMWYNKQKPGLGKRFTQEVRRKVHKIRQNPFAYSIRHGITRIAILKVFPFILHFSVNDNNTVLISAVLHTGRNADWIDNDKV